MDHSIAHPREHRAEVTQQDRDTHLSLHTQPELMRWSSGTNDLELVVKSHEAGSSIRKVKQLYNPLTVCMQRQGASRIMD